MDPAEAPKRVLVVDDDQSLLEGLESVLVDAGEEVVACNTFGDAREALKTEHFDVLILDVRLGDFNGLQLALIGRERNPDARIIVFSGYTDAVLEAEAERIGAIFVTKPVYPDQLIELIRKKDHTIG
jgi:DNA-binding NtrC family response regulator